MNKLIGVLFIGIFTACNTDALDKRITAETALNDVINIEKQEGELPRHQQKFLNSIAFIADDKGIDQAKTQDLFKLFSDSGITYKMVLDELDAKEKFEQNYTQEYLMPIYQQIDSLCIERQYVVTVFLNGTPQQLDSLINTGVDTGFLSYVNPEISNHYIYNTPETLTGECGYISKQDSLHKQYDVLYSELKEELLAKFYLTTTYYRKLNNMFDVHQ